MTHSLIPDGSVTTPGGFRVTGLHAGLKPTRDRDLGLLVARTPCAAAVHCGAHSGSAGAWSTARLRQHSSNIQALLWLSGVDAGRGAAAVAACDSVADLLADEALLQPQQILLLAAGPREALPLDALRSGVARALDELDSHAARRLGLALALDAETPRHAAVSVGLPAGAAAIGGLAVGQRLLLTTDAAVKPKNLQLALNTLLGRHPQRDQGELVLLASGSGAPVTNKLAFGTWLAALLALVEHLDAE